MGLQGLLLLVVSTTAAARDASEEKINQKRSVESFLSQLSFNPFTPFPELLTTTPTAPTTPTTPTRPSIQATKRPKLRSQKLDKTKIRKFPVFVAVEKTTTRRTILPTFVQSDEDSKNLDAVKSDTNPEEVLTNSVTNSESQLSDKEWIASILSRTNSQRTDPTTRVIQAEEIPGKQGQQIKVAKPAFHPAQLNAKPDIKKQQQKFKSEAIQLTGRKSIPQKVVKEAYPEVFRTIPTNMEDNKEYVHQPGKYSSLALSLFQYKQQFPSQELPSHQLGHQSTFQQQLSQQRFMEKNRHRLFAQPPQQSQPSQHSHHFQQSQQELSFNSLDNNYQTNF